MYLGGLFHPYILEESICYLRGIRCKSLGLFGSRQNSLLANIGDPDQMPHYGASDLGLHCLPMYPFRVSQQQWVNAWKSSRNMLLNTNEILSCYMRAFQSNNGQRRNIYWLSFALFSLCCSLRVHFIPFTLLTQNVPASYLEQLLCCCSGMTLVWLWFDVLCYLDSST